VARVVVTGAAGSLGRVVVPELVRRGHLVRAFDQRPLPSLAADGPGSVDEVVGDLRDADTVRALVDGADAVLHGAAVHGIHRDRFTPRDFWDINATGTFAVYDACRQEGVAKVVLASSMAVYGASSERTDAAWAVVTDDSDVMPNDEYGLSKHGCETMAVDAARAWGIETVALRLGMFVPETFERYGFRLLFGGVDDRDSPPPPCSPSTTPASKGSRPSTSLLPRRSPLLKPRRWRPTRGPSSTSTGQVLRRWSTSRVTGATT
jgi:nucleoside-diphosphate-sugar epimerase